jgi:hypothetical protein
MTIEHAESHLAFTLQGTWDVDQILGYSRDIVVALMGTEHRRALVDLILMEGALSMEERFRMGSGLGPIFTPANRVAVVQEIKEQNGYAAKMANRRGAKMQVFSHRDDALLWLLS